MSSASTTNLRNKNEESTANENSECKSTCSTKSKVCEAKNFVSSFLEKSVVKRGKNIKKFIRESKTPKAREFKELFRGHLVGLLLIGLFAYIIKVIHIPINNMIVGSSK